MQWSTVAPRWVGRHVLGAFVVLAMAGITASCGSAAPSASAPAAASVAPSASATSPTPAASATLATPATPGVFALVAPAAGAVVKQNDPSLATSCPASATHGFGYAIDFRWTIPVGLVHVSGFQVVLQHGTGSPIPLDVAGSTTTSFTWLACNTFIIDNNLTTWHWHVTAVDSGKKVVATSEVRAMTFGPCRLANGTTCNAPA